MRTESDWKMLARLFGGERAAFRHHMGLSKASARAFYAPTSEAAEIRAQKQTILDLPASDQYFLETDEGQLAFGEFARAIGCETSAPPAALDRKARHRAATLALEPDWLLLTPPDWKLVWASVCFPTRWSLAGKARQPLAGIHAVVPGLNEQLGRQIGVFFARLIPGEGWGRVNWGLSSNGNRNQHPCQPYTPLSDQIPIEEVYVRVESQHLLKLPETGAIAFGIRILNFPLAEAVQYPDIAAGLREQLRTMPAEVAAYKGIPPDFWRRFESGDDIHG